MTKKAPGKQKRRNDTFLIKKKIQMTVDFSADTMKTTKKWDNIFQVAKVQNCQSRTLYPEKNILQE